MDTVTLYGVFPSGPYANPEDAELIKQARRKALLSHDIEVITGIAQCKLCGMQDDALDSPCPEWKKNLTKEAVMARYPALVAQIIAESLGYACPSTAANILRDVIQKKENWCEWIASCYKCDPRMMLEQCIRTRHYHKGYMADYKQAMALVARALYDGREPLFSSWF
jgi:hypothetical protein